MEPFFYGCLDPQTAVDASPYGVIPVKYSPYLDSSKKRQCLFQLVCACFLSLPYCLLMKCQLCFLLPILPLRCPQLTEALHLYIQDMLQFKGQKLLKRLCKLITV